MNLAGGLGTPEAAAGRASGRRDAPSRVEGTTTIRSGSARACGSDDDQGTRPSPIAEREKAAARFSVIPRLQALRAWPRQPVHRFLNRSGCGERCPTRVISAGEHDPRESHARARGRTHPTRPPTTDPDTSARSNRARPRDSDPWEWSVDRRTPSRGRERLTRNVQSHHGDAGGCDAGGGARSQADGDQRVWTAHAAAQGTNRDVRRAPSTVDERRDPGPGPPRAV